MTVWQPHHYQKVTGGFIQMKNEIKNLAHSSYRCQYHIVFVPDVFCKLSAEGHLHLVCWNPIQEFLFKGAKKFSILALSKQWFTPLRLCRTPALLSFSRNASLMYWFPRSLCIIAPFSGNLLAAALNVSIHSSLRILLRITREIISPLKQSTIGDIYNLPSSFMILDIRRLPTV